MWQKELYIDEVNRQLSNEKFYKKENKDKTIVYNKIIKDTISRFISQGKLPENAYNLIIPSARTAKFYVLPKIHKVGNPGRPIVSTCNCPTEKISSFLDELMQPIVKQLPSYIKDTTDALNVFNNFTFDTNDKKFIFTMDVKSLYTVIPHSEGLKALRHFFDKRAYKYPPTDTLIRLAELVLTTNTFKFQDKCYTQVAGVAMGTKMGPSYACLFMGYLEEMFFKSYHGPKPDLFKRFIDDIIGAASISNQQLQSFIESLCNFHPDIDYTYDISEDSLPFLDTTVTPSGNHLKTSVHYKKTDSHNTLLYSSSHPKSCRDAIPYSQFLRLRRICSDDHDFEEKASEMKVFFMKRDYPQIVIDQALNKAKHLDRRSVLSYQSDRNDTDRIPLILTYHPTNITVKDVILKHYNILTEDDHTSTLFTKPPMLSWRRDSNLKDLLVHSELKDGKTPGSKPCGRRRCQTCKHISDVTKIGGPRGDFFVNETFTCTSMNVVYCIVCKKCNKIYVGETLRKLGDRSAEHLKSIRDRYLLPVAKHFNSEGHSISDYTILGLKHTQTRKHRKRMEKYIIHKLGTLSPHGMNLKFSYI